MSLGSRLAFWLPSIAFSPLLVVQAMWTAWRTPRLPEASGPRKAMVDSPDEADSKRPGSYHPFSERTAMAPLQLLVAGESTSVGVGVASLDEALAGRLAVEISARSGRRVAWEVVGANGARVEDLVTLLEASALAPQIDLAVLSMGVNDTVKLSTTRRWLAGLQRITEALRAAGVVHIAWARVPPVGWFSALPRPLRWLLGLRARQLDRALREWATQAGTDVHYLQVILPLRPDLLAEDGYHPGREGYRLWASLLVDQLQARRLIEPARGESA